eukprot:jgi/Mesvir1/28930/Mv17715-RA.1
MNASRIGAVFESAKSFPVAAKRLPCIARRIARELRPEILVKRSWYPGHKAASLYYPTKSAWAVRPLITMASDRKNAGAAPAPSGNRLASQESPYLLQHANNPVDWYPWGEEAFQAAKESGKPIFLSVGYSTCHWCHVMEHESFESTEVAEIMNREFINIKVDREERPDVDKVYMTYLQATSGGGGWPMSVFLTPDLKPFLAGTYYPPEDNYGRPGFKTILTKVAAAWKSQKDAISKGVEQAMEQLADASVMRAGRDSYEMAEAKKIISLCSLQLAERYDEKLGGFSGAGGRPKFPRPCELFLLFRAGMLASSAMEPGRADSGAAATGMALASLEKMAGGGIHDHVGGGFHRYSVDEYWHVPHFEKMMYDQAQLVVAYLEAYSLTRDRKFARSARDTLDYVLRDMRHAEGGIFSAEDADSAPIGGGRKKEGLFYLWDVAEIESILGKDKSAVFCDHYYVKRGGNCDLSPFSDPHGEFAGKCVLYQTRAVEDTASRHGLSVEDCDALLADAREKMFQERAKRPRPHLDDKVITSWNGLTISALAKASVTLDPMSRCFPAEGRDPQEYLDAALAAANFVQSKLLQRREGGGAGAGGGAASGPLATKLKRSFRKGPSEADGFVDDYAFLIAGLLDLYEASGQTRWLAWAMDLQATQDELFWDADGSGYFSTAAGDASILLRMKEEYDGAEPSGNSVAATNLLRLHGLLSVASGEALRDKAQKTIAVFDPSLKKMPVAMPQMCCALFLLASATKCQVIIAGSHAERETRELLHAAHACFAPDKVVMLVDPDNGSDDPDFAFWQKHNPSVTNMAKRVKGKPAAYVCQNFTCQAPVTTAAELVALLAKDHKPTPKKATPFDLGKLSKG